MEIGKKSLALILSYEGMDQPSQWPGSASGITIGRGYDLGYEKSFKDDWSFLDSTIINKLSKAIGVKGTTAANMAKQFKGIVIKKSDADNVFHDKTLPKYISWTIQAFPNSDKLPDEAFGALVSIVFNRGPLTEDKKGSDRRKEMKAIKDILSKNPEPDSEVIKQIANQVKSMARLWADNKNSDGDLHDRRIAESKLILSVT